MRARAIAASAIAAAVLLTAACGPSSLSELRTVLRQTRGMSKQLLKDARAVKRLSGLSGKDRALQHSLLIQADQRIVGQAVDDMDRRILVVNVVTNDGKQTADAALTDVDLGQKFLDDLEEVTRELVKGTACQEVLDLVSSPPDVLGETKTWTDAKDELIGRMLLKGWGGVPLGRWNQYIDWVLYGQGVAEDAIQVKDSLLAGSTNIERFASPPMQRAAVAYARYCYATPHKP
jgi:hypothetical protein